MVTVQAVRDLGGFEGLDSAHLGRLIVKATSLVHLDLAVFDAAPSAENLDRLIELKTCVLAERLQRTPVSESAGGLSATYEPIQWAREYSSALKEVLDARGKAVARGIM